MNEPARLPLLIVDDHAVLAGALASSLEARGFVVDVAIAFDAASLGAAVRERGGAVVILDLYLSSTATSLDLIKPLIGEGAIVVVLTASAESRLLAEARRQGAHAVLDKAMPFDDLLQVITYAAAGDVRRLRHLDRAIGAGGTADHVVSVRVRPVRLSPRETAVLRRLLDGLSPAEIASVEHVAVTTVRSQLSSIFTKLGVNSQREVIALAHRQGWRGGEFINLDE